MTFTFLLSMKQWNITGRILVPAFEPLNSAFLHFVHHLEPRYLQTTAAKGTCVLFKMSTFMITLNVTVQQDHSQPLKQLCEIKPEVEPLSQLQ